MPTQRRPKRERDLAALAAKWGVDAVGRHMPEKFTLLTGAQAVQNGKWYIVRDGERIDANPLQATTMDLVVGPLLGSVGPIAATKH